METPNDPGTTLDFRLPLAQGEDVRLAQLALARAGLLRGEPDGVFGPLTREAVLLFQRREGLPPDGTIEGATSDRLLGQPGLARPRPWAEALRPYLARLQAPHGPPTGQGRQRWRLVATGISVEGEERRAAAPARPAPRPAAGRSIARRLKRRRSASACRWSC
jgi:peptidoglycan hydrolase-like protein with peptidoglycan-binding domain